MKKLYYTLFILSSLIIGTAANIYDGTEGLVTGEVEEDTWYGSGGIEDVLVQDRVTLEYAITDWGGEFTFTHSNMQRYEVYPCTLYFTKDGYNEFTVPVSIQGGTSLDLGLLIMQRAGAARTIK